MAITAVNLRGIRMTALASRLMMCIMTFSAVLFVGLAAYYVVHHHGCLVQGLGRKFSP